MTDPILVTGAHRSGTTWVGRMLCAGGEAFYIHEPFNNVRQSGPTWVPKPFPHWFYSIADADAEYARLLRNVVEMRYPLLPALAQSRTAAHFGRAARDWALSLAARLRRRRPLLKDPIALFSAEWLARRFGMRVVVLIRHPAAFAASVKRLEWWFKFSNWLEQERLMGGDLAAFAEPIRRYVAGKKDLVDQAVLMWNGMYSAVSRYRTEHPDWLFVRHEDLAAEPLREFPALYRHCRLTWNAAAEAGIRKYSERPDAGPLSGGRPTDIRRESRKTVSVWRRILTPEEAERVREGTRAVAKPFYSDGDW
ncbi:MAG: sulfotransferase [Anaerolineales bacterium]|nr:sulfotransferase [Anaerolineales bacterium]